MSQNVYMSILLTLVSSLLIALHKQCGAADMWTFPVEQAELEDQEHDFDGAFHFMPQTRQAGTDGLCRTEAEKANPELMKLIHEVHFNLEQSLRACHLQTLHDVLQASSGHLYTTRHEFMLMSMLAGR